MPAVLVAAVAPGLALAGVVAAVVVVVVVVGLVAVMLERRRRNRRFARKLSPYERRRSPGDGQIVDPNDRPGF